MDGKQIIAGMLLGVALGAGAAPAAAPPDARVQQLIAQLDADGFKEREAASKELVALGDAAVPALTAAANQGATAFRERVRDTLIAIELECLRKPRPMGLPTVTTTEADAVETMLRAISFTPNEDLQEYLAKRRAPLKWGGAERTWLELQEQICAATKTRWRWVANDLVVVPQKTALPTARIGALQVTFERSVERHWQLAGGKFTTMELHFAVGADPRVLPISSAESVFQIDEATGPDDQKLAVEPPLMMGQRPAPKTLGAASFSHFADRREWDVQMTIPTPAEGVTRINKLSGRLMLKVATNFRDSEIADLAKPGVLAHETVLGTLTRAALTHTSKDGHRLAIDWRYPADKKWLALAESELAVTRMVVTGDDGTRWRPTVDSFKDEDGTWKFVLALQPLSPAPKGPPQKMTWRIAEHWRSMEVPFTLKDLPLERSKPRENDKPPERETP